MALGIVHMHIVFQENQELHIVIDQSEKRRQRYRRKREKEVDKEKIFLTKEFNKRILWSGLLKREGSEIVLNRNV